MLTDKQKFRYGFLQKCADAGLTAEQALKLAEHGVEIVKEAMEKRANPAAAAGGAAAPAALGLGALFNNPITAGLMQAGKSLGGYALPAAMIAPPVLGAVGGGLLARMTDVDDETIKSIRKQELIGELRRNRQLLEQKRRTYRPTA